MREEKVTCDTCGADLNATSNCVDYRLTLTAELLPSRSESVTMMMIYPPIDRDRHYCGVRCLVNDPKLVDRWNGARFQRDADQPMDRVPEQ